MAYLTTEQLEKIGLKHLGENVMISDKASIYNAGNIAVDDNARIDDFCILSAGKGRIHIGKYVHVGCYSSMIGDGAIILNDLSGVSGRVSIYSSSDDFRGAFMAHPTIPDEHRNVMTGDVVLEEHVVVGAGCVILPNVTLEVGVSVGAMSLVKENCRKFGVYAGIPAKRIGDRSEDILKVGDEFLNRSDRD